MEKKYAYATLVLKDEQIWGAICLYYSIKKQGIKYPFIFVINSNCSEAVFNVLNELMNKSNNIIIKKISLCNCCNDYRLNETNGIFTLLNEIEYEKILYLSHDVLLYGNLNNLFNNTHEYIIYKNKGYGMFLGLMILHPDNELFNKIKNNSNKYLSDVLFNNCKNILVENINNAINDIICLGGTDYYWNIFNISTLNDCEKFLNISNDILKGIEKWGESKYFEGSNIRK